MTQESTLHDPLKAFGRARRAYVLPDLKVLYISIAKNACTTIKWLLSELADEDPAQFAPGSGRYLTPDEGIHARSRWQHTPTLGKLTPGFRSTISPENGWFVFAVVRDPRPRFFSAWQNKFLLRNPSYLSWRGEPWYPRVPQVPEQVREDFATFVDLVHSSPDAKVAHDAHFESQSKYLSENVVPYSRIYEIGELRTMVSELADHVHARGYEGDLRLRTSNDTPLRATADVFDGPVKGQIEDLFAVDFERFGHLWDFSKVEAAPGWSQDSMNALRSQIVMSERIGELVDRTRSAQRRTQRARRRAIELEAQLKKARAANRRLRRAASASATRAPVWRRTARRMAARVRSLPGL